MVLMVGLVATIDHGLSRLGKLEIIIMVQNGVPGRVESDEVGEV